MVEELLSAESHPHEELLNALLQRHTAQFPSWLRELQGGASVCLYGWGSKRAVLTAFARSHLIPQGEVPRSCGSGCLVTSMHHLSLFQQWMMRLMTTCNPPSKSWMACPQRS